MRLRTKLEITDGDFILMMEAGFALLNAGRIQDALDIFQGCSIMFPESELPLIGIARCYAYGGKLVRAEEWAGKALRVNSKSPISQLCLAEILLMEGKKQECLKILNKFNVDNYDSSIRKWSEGLIKCLRKDRKINFTKNK